MNKSWSQPSSLSTASGRSSSSYSPAPRSVISTEEPRLDGHGSPSSTIRMTSEEKTQLPYYLEPLKRSFAESYITSEYCLVTTQRKLGGVYVIPSRENPFLWFGVIFVHHGPYQGGVFRFILEFPDFFPVTNIVPTVTFQPSVFHPMIHPNKGHFELRRYFKSWSKQNHAWQILKVVRNAFYKIEGSTVNKRANDLFENDLIAFAVKAQQEVKLSHERLYLEQTPLSNDPHWIKFSPYTPAHHDSIRAKMLSSIKPMSDLINIRIPNNSKSNTLGNASSTDKMITVSQPKNGRGTSFM